jgi:hypothetical protein
MSEGGVRLGGSPSLWIEGSGQWVAVTWEEPGPDTRHLLGYGVPEAISSSVTGYLESLKTASPDEPAQWVLSLERPSRALFGKPGPGADEVTLYWQEAADGSAAVEQTVPMSELELWPGALDLYGPPDPDEVRNPKHY